MITTRPIVPRALVVALSAAALAAPAATASDLRTPDARDAALTHVQDLRSPDARDAVRPVPDVPAARMPASPAVADDTSALPIVVSFGALLAFAAAAVPLRRRAAARTVA